jgi:hypothetical protein
MIPMRFRLRTLMILLIPAAGVGAWAYRLLPKCPVHGTVMWRKDVPMKYGLFRSGPSDLQYFQARSSQFPNCDGAVLGGCVVMEPTMSKDICRTCNATRDAWRLAQTKPAPAISAIWAGPNSGVPAPSGPN